jgi:hypothetical protein
MKNIFFKSIYTITLIVIGLSMKAQTITPTTEFPYIKVHSIDGVGWSTPIGTSLKSGNVYWTYIDPQLNGVVAMKTPDGIITSTVVITNIQNNDNHAEMSLGVDNDGYIHVMGGHHNSSPKYYVSSKPEDIRTWDFRGNDTTIGGIEGKGITYQGFYRSNNGTLYVAMRSNLLNNFHTGDRSIALGRYNTQTKKWKMLGGKNYVIPKRNDCFCMEPVGSWRYDHLWLNGTLPGLSIADTIRQKQRNACNLQHGRQYKY